MLWQSDPASPSEFPEEQPVRPDEPPSEDDVYDRLLDSQMVSEGCPNCRKDD